MKVSLEKLVLAVAALAGMSGCASIGPPEAPSLELPKAPTDLRAARKGNQVTLTWTIPTRTTERQSVRFLGKTQVCRSLTGAIKECGTPVGEISGPAMFAEPKSPAKKLTATFSSDLDPAMEQANPAGFATFAIEVLNTAGRGAGISNQVRVSLVPTVSAFAGFAAAPAPQGILITWLCAGVQGENRNGIKHLFRIYRRAEGSGRVTKVGELAALCIDGPRADAASADLQAQKRDGSKASFLDQSFEWEKTYFYRGTVVSVLEEPGKPTVEVEGDDTPEVKVFAHDVFPPAVPGGLQAVFSGPGQAPFIDLIWTPGTDSDLAGYNVYRREQDAPLVKVNVGLVKIPAFRDEQVLAGKTYFYSVSAVDERGNESNGSEEAGESAPRD